METETQSQISQVEVEELDLNILIDDGVDLDDVKVMKDAGILTFNNLILNEQALTGIGAISDSKAATIWKAACRSYQSVKLKALIFASKRIREYKRMHEKEMDLHEKEICVGYAYCVAEFYTRSECADHMVRYNDLSALSSYMVYNQILEKDVGGASNFMLCAEVSSRDRKHLKTLKKSDHLSERPIFLKEMNHLLRISICGQAKLQEELTNKLELLRSKIPTKSEFSLLNNAMCTKSDLQKHETEMKKCFSNSINKALSVCKNSSSAQLDSIFRSVRCTGQVVKAFLLRDRAPHLIQDPAGLQSFLEEWVEN